MHEKPQEKLQELFEHANQDPCLKMRLLSSPEEVCKERGVELDPHAIQRLKSIGTFVALSNEIINGKLFRPPNPVFYPAGVWQKNAALDLFKNLFFETPFINKKDWIFYPAEILTRVEEKIEKKLALPTAGR